MSKFNDIINSSTPTLVDFHATWCGPCKTMAPILDEVKNNLHNNVRILKVDVDKNQSVAQKFQVRGVPTFILFKNGKMLWKESGVINARELESKIKPFY